MKTTIYYFTGTGNSLVISKDLSEIIPDCKIKSISNLSNNNEIKTDTEKVGFVFPLYFWGMPKIVADFIKKINLEKAEYIFYIVTSGGKSSPLYIYNYFEKILKIKNKTINAGFRIVMPSNYIKKYDTDSKEIIKKKIQQSKLRVKSISKIIINNKDNINKGKLGFLAKIVNEIWQKNVYKSDAKFFTDKKCNSCGICLKICKVDNIKLVEGKPQWLHHCQECLACMHFCPQASIQYGEETINRERYHHPEITDKDIINQK